MALRAFSRTIKSGGWELAPSGLGGVLGGYTSNDKNDDCGTHYRLLLNDFYP